ncbi:hypothetical protein [Bradyrhizobium sp.]|uniref:COG4223 family protein n=1 Tax=Bradyrhizobium sp. TaxID=376 RepID=UPI0025C1FB58|nr:hypothetical protein [Bradyrhizobium sp.]
MAEDRPDELELPPDAGRARRAPPTIDLEATEVSGESQASSADAGAEPDVHPKRSFQWAWRAAISSTLISAVSGACAAALVIAAAWLMGWPGEPAAPPAPAVNSAAIDDLAARIAGVESRINKPAASDPAAAVRVDALEKSVAALRSDLAGLSAQSEKLASDVKDVKSAPRDAAAAPDLTAINERIAGLERAARAQSTDIAQESTRPVDDVALRRIVAAALLDVLVRVGDPYPAALTAAKSLAPNPDALKPLDGFAASGVPSAPVLSRELLALVPKLSPPSPENSTTGAGLVDRLQAGAAKLVRIERTDAVGNSSGNVVARVTAAALRNEYKEARRELETLPPADRTAAQGWIEKADARDAALAVSRQFAAEAMTALAKPAP